MRGIVTFSRSLTLVPTEACANQCAYCGFYSPRHRLLALEEAQAILERARTYGCREVLVMSGERPWETGGFPLDEGGYIDYIYQLAIIALRLGLLPHTNIGVLSPTHLVRLKSVNASMGLMLETANPYLAAHRYGKDIVQRIAHIEAAGRLRIPFTTGILVGIGESAADRREALLLIQRLHGRYGHIQEVIIQNFKPKPNTPMSYWPEPPLADMVETIRQARALMPGMPIQVPPNLNRELGALLMAGANDLGGVSPEADRINPEHPWPSVEQLAAKVEAAGFHLRERLPVYPQVDADLAPAADVLRRELVGDIVTYVVNCNVNFTNICASNCSFCAFRRSVHDGDAYLLSLEDIVNKVRWAVGQGATEICIQGGLHPNLRLDYYLSLLKAVKRPFPRLHIHAFSPMEVWWLARQSDFSLSYALSALRENGLDSMPGTAAEILDDELRRRICPGKLTTREWIQVITTAHRLGIPTTATMMFGHIETWQHRIKHLEVLRHIQLETGGFTELVLLPFVPWNTRLARRHRLGPVPLEEVLKVTAYCRLFLGRDLINIQNSWVKIGVEGAKRSLACGANDFGGTLMEENISRCAGARHGQYLSPQQIETAIMETGRTPSQRDTLYQTIPGVGCLAGARP